MTNTTETDTTSLSAGATKEAPRLASAARVLPMIDSTGQCLRMVYAWPIGPTNAYECSELVGKPDPRTGLAPCVFHKTESILTNAHGLALKALPGYWKLHGYRPAAAKVEG